MPDEGDGERFTFVLRDKAHVKSHCALRGRSMVDFINEAVQEKIQRDIISPPKVIIVGISKDKLPVKPGRPPVEE